MKHSTRRALDKWLFPAIVGVATGYTYGYLEHRVRPATSLSVLFIGGLMVLALTAWDLWRSDEMERRIYHVAMTTTFFGSAATVLLAGLAQIHGAPVPNWGWIIVMMFVFYMVGGSVAWFRYR